LQRPERNIHCQDSSSSQRSLRIIVQAKGIGKPKQGKQRMQVMVFRMLA